MTQMTVEQAKTSIMAEEFTAQIAVLTEKLAVERVLRLQLEQKVEEQRKENDMLIEMMPEPDLVDDPKETSDEDLVKDGPPSFD